MIEEINRIMNHPDIYPYVAFGFPYPIDFAPFMHYGVLAFVDDGMCLLAEKKGHDYEIHIAILPEKRGKSAVQKCKKIFGILFSEHDANRLFSRIPVINKSAIMFARIVGMKFKEMKIEKICDIDCACEIYSMNGEDYAASRNSSRGSDCR